MPSLKMGSLPHEVMEEKGYWLVFLNPHAPPECTSMTACYHTNDQLTEREERGVHHLPGRHAAAHTDVPSSSGPAPVGAPYQVALASSQLGSAVKAESLKVPAAA